MLGMTHLTTGLAAALMTVQPGTMGELLACAAGGAAGSVLCDVECRSGKGQLETMPSRLTASALVLSALAADWWLNSGLWITALSESRLRIAAGAVLLLTACLMGRLSPHRGFSHSLLYAAMLSGGAWLLCQPLGMPVLSSCLTHLALDSLNRRPIRLLWPLKGGFCLGICRADKKANRVLMWTGLALDVWLLMRLLPGLSG